MKEWNQWLVISIIHLVDKSFLCIFSGPLLPAFYSGLLRLETASLSHLSKLPLLWAKTSLTFLFSEPKLLSASNSLTYVLSSSLICLFSQALLLWANLFAELLPLQATPFLSNLFSGTFYLRCIFSDRMILRCIGFSEPFLLWAASSLSYFLSQLLLLGPLPSLSYFSELPFLSPRSRVARELHSLMKLSFTLLLQCIWQHPVALPHSPRSRIWSESMEHNSNAFRVTTACNPA